MTMKRRLQRLEEQALPDADLTALSEWAHTLALDDLSCVIAIGPRSELIRVPEGLTFDEARARGFEVLQRAPVPIRRLFEETDEETT